MLSPKTPSFMASETRDLRSPADGCISLHIRRAHGDGTPSSEALHIQRADGPTLSAALARFAQRSVQASYALSDGQLHVWAPERGPGCKLMVERPAEHPRGARDTLSCELETLPALIACLREL